MEGGLIWLAIIGVLVVIAVLIVGAAAQATLTRALDRSEAQGCPEPGRHISAVAAAPPGA